MERAGYHGGFEHPVRAFVLGVGLLVLLFGGFAVGIEAGGKKHATGLSVITHVQVRELTVPVVSTVVGPGRTKLVQLPGLTEYRFVVIRRGGQRAPLMGWVRTSPAKLTGTPVAPIANNLSTVYTAVPSTSYETVTTTVTDVQTVTAVQTVTSTETQTTTVTDTTPTTVPTSNSTGSPPPSSGP